MDDLRWLVYYKVNFDLIRVVLCFVYIKLDEGKENGFIKLFKLI